MTLKKKTDLAILAGRLLLFPIYFFLKLPFFRKERKLQFTGKTLIFCGDNPIDAYLSTVFLQLFHGHLGQTYDIPAQNSFLANSPGCQKVIKLNQGFLGKVQTLRKLKYKTIIDLRPTPSFMPAFAHFLGGARYRVGFTVGGKNPFFNFHFPYNQFITHFTHQLKSLFESVTLQKIPEMPHPKLSASPPGPSHNGDSPHEYALIQMDSVESWPEVPFEKFIPFLEMDSPTNKLVICNDKRLPELSNMLKTRKEIRRIPEPPLTELIILAEKAKWYGGVNSLAAHLVAQSKGQTHILFTSSNERLYQPFSVLSRTYTANVPCRPCARPWLRHECLFERQFACTETTISLLPEKKPEKERSRTTRIKTEKG